MPSSKPRALSRDIILSAALELVDEEGLSALSLRSLGKRLGVSQAAFYRHIPDKAALLEGISEQVWRLTFDSFLARVEGGKVDVPGRSESTASSEATHDAPGAPQAASASPLLAYMSSTRTAWPPRFAHTRARSCCCSRTRCRLPSSFLSWRAFS